MKTLEEYFKIPKIRKHYYCFNCKLHFYPPEKIKECPVCEKTTLFNLNKDKKYSYYKKPVTLKLSDFDKDNKKQ